MSQPNAKCSQRFSVCRDVLFMIAEFCKKQPYEQIVGIMNALQNDPKPIDPETGRVIEKPKLVVHPKDDDLAGEDTNIDES